MQSRASRGELTIVDKRALSPSASGGICTQVIKAAQCKAGWDEMLQISEEVRFIKGRIIVRGNPVSRRSDPRFAIIPLTSLVGGKGLK